MLVDKQPLFVVWGAFGTGKTTLAALVAPRLRECLVFDADWLIEPLSVLAGRELSLQTESWPALGDVWLALAHAAAAADRPTVLFTPASPDEIEALASRASVGETHYLLLDCADEAIRERLKRRDGWPEEWTRESLVDASRYRAMGGEAMRADEAPPEPTADAIVAWVRRCL